MRRFSTADFEDFLRRVDAELKRDCNIVLVGGGAVALKYKGTHVTSDLDLWSISEAVAVEAAGITTYALHLACRPWCSASDR